MAHKSQKLAALSLLEQSSEPLSLSLLAAAIGNTPHRTLRRWLTSWHASGVIDKVGQGRATQYQYRQPSKSNKSFLFLKGLDKDLRVSLLNQLRDLWTYNSTAIEGNTLTLGDTHFVLEQGLTISGKPLKDHQVVIGHAKAIELLYKGINQDLTELFLYDLHQTVLTDYTVDIYKPVGNWKIETNGTYAVTSDGTQTFIEYANPKSVPELMSQLIEEINSINIKSISISNAHLIYAKIHMGIARIHPFWDGNGRIARLIANIPLLKAGLPPIVIPQEQRQHYIQSLANYQINIGQLDLTTGVWPDISYLKEFESFCELIYLVTKELVENAFVVQENRDEY